MDLVELERQAAELLPASVYDYFAGGAFDELTVAANADDWGRLRLRPRVLRDVSSVSTATTVLGTSVAAPVLVAPTANQRLAHPEGEAATAAGTAAAGSLMVLSTRSTTPVEEVAAAAPNGPRWYQVYVLRDRGRTISLVERSVEAGCAALVLTADTPQLGRRLRDLRNAFVLPTEVTNESLAGPAELAAQDPSLTFDDIGWLAERSNLPVVVKGVLRGDDARRCLDSGASAIVVSNHGGRQLDTAMSGAAALPEVVEAVAGRVEVYVDGGVRRGTDVMKALALGARAVLVGRPVIWGLTTGGAAGVQSVLEALGEELALAMSLCGCRAVDEIDADLVTGP